MTLVRPFETIQVFLFSFFFTQQWENLEIRTRILKMLK